MWREVTDDLKVNSTRCEPNEKCSINLERSFSSFIFLLCSEWTSSLHTSTPDLEMSFDETTLTGGSSSIIWIRDEAERRKYFKHDLQIFELHPFRVVPNFFWLETCMLMLQMKMVNYHGCKRMRLRNDNRVFRIWRNICVSQPSTYTQNSFGV